MPVTEVTAKDTPNDAGGSISIRWGLSPDDHEGGKVKQYIVLRAVDENGTPGEFKEIGDVTAGATELADGNTDDGVKYFYKVEAINSEAENGNLLWSVGSESDVAGPVESKAQWFNRERSNVLVGVIILCFFIVYYINQAKAGKALFIRKIAGLEVLQNGLQ